MQMRASAVVALTVCAATASAQFSPLIRLSTWDPIVGGSPGESMTIFSGVSYDQGVVHVSARTTLQGLPKSFIAKASNRQALVALHHTDVLDTSVGTASDPEFALLDASANGSLLFGATANGFSGVWRADAGATKLIARHNAPAPGLPDRTFIMTRLGTELLADGRHVVVGEVPDPILGVSPDGVFTGDVASTQPRLVGREPVPGFPTRRFSPNTRVWERSDSFGRKYVSSYASTGTVPIGCVWRVDATGAPTPVVTGNEPVVGSSSTLLDGEMPLGAVNGNGTPFVWAITSASELGIFRVEGGQAIPMLIEGQSLPAFGPGRTFNGVASQLSASNSNQVSLKGRIRVQMGGGTFSLRDAFLLVTPSGTLPLAVRTEAEPLVAPGWNHNQLGTIISNASGWVAFSSGLESVSPLAYRDCLFVADPSGVRHLLIDGTRPFEIEPGLTKTVAVVAIDEFDDDGTLVVKVRWTDQTSSIVTFVVPSPGALAMLGVMFIGLGARRQRVSRVGTR